jgi:hypothetical protein
MQAGVSPAEIKHRLGAGALIRVHRGVYRVGHCAPSLEARYLAAVKACGQRSAGHLFALLKGSAPLPEVLTPTERG